MQLCKISTTFYYTLGFELETEIMFSYHQEKKLKKHFITAFSVNFLFIVFIVTYYFCFLFPFECTVMNHHAFHVLMVEE